MKKKIALLISVLFVCFGVFAQQQAKPKNGDGIISFLKRHGYTINDQAEFERINKGKFGKNKALLLHISYQLPEKKNTAQTGKNKNELPKEIPQKGGKRIGQIYKEPLFGKQHQDYSIKSTDLVGACFFLSSGHGGPDPGAIANIKGKDLHEDEYAYDVMLRLARNLMEHGATVHIIIQDAKDGIRNKEYLDNSNRETCMGAAIPRAPSSRLKQRTDKINELSKKSGEKYQRAIFIHLDSQGKKKQLDVYFYHQKKNASKQLAQTMCSTFRTQYKKHQPNRGFSGTVTYRSDLYVMNNTQPISIFTELANMQNEFDRSRYLKVDNRQAMANWMLKGFVDDYKNSKK